MRRANVHNFPKICMRGFLAALELALAHTTHSFFCICTCSGVQLCEISNIFAHLHIPSHIYARNCTQTPKGTCARTKIITKVRSL